MAIDTAEKRKNIAGLYSFVPVSVTPNASKDVEWRQQAGWGYAGINATSPPIVHFGNFILVPFRDKRLYAEVRDKRAFASFRDKRIL